MIFGRKKQEGSTVLLLDIENGSVGAALVRLSPNQAPRLFGETRIHAPIVKTHSVGRIAEEVEAAARKALEQVNQVAARLRQGYGGHAHIASLGEIMHTAIFMSPPWGSLDLAGDMMPHPITQGIYNALDATLPQPLSTSFHPFATATAHIVPSLFPHEEQYLLCIITGEVIEFVALERMPQGSVITGHATLPMGQNSILRTLMSHGGLSQAEALSLVRLATRNAPHPSLGEPLNTFATHLAEEFKSVVEQFTSSSPIRSVFIVAPEPAGEWFARSLAEHPSIEGLFPHGGTVRAVRGSHISPYLSAHAPTPDLALLVEGLFVDARLAIR